MPQDKDILYEETGISGGGEPSTGCAKSNPGDSIVLDKSSGKERSRTNLLTKAAVILGLLLLVVALATMIGLLVQEKAERKKTEQKQSQKLTDLSNALVDVQMEIKELRNESDGYCPVKYEGKCFWVVGPFEPGINFADGTEICADLGGKPANIYSEEHYNMMIEYMSTFTTKDDWIDAWLGMTYVEQSNTTLLSDGSTAPFVKWYLGYPRSDRCCNMGLWAEMDDKRTDKHMSTYSPSSTLQGVICEK